MSGEPKINPLALIQRKHIDGPLVWCGCKTLPPEIACIWPDCDCARVKFEGDPLSADLRGEAIDRVKLTKAETAGTVTVKLPPGYRDGEEFAKDCGFELVEPVAALYRWPASIPSQSEQKGQKRQRGQVWRELLPLAALALFLAGFMAGWLIGPRATPQGPGGAPGWARGAPP